MSYLPPPVVEPPSYSLDRHDSPKRRHPRLGTILTIMALAAVVGFLAALITSILTPT